MLCLFFCNFLHFLISFKYDLCVNAERMIVQKRETCKEISASMV